MSENLEQNLNDKVGEQGLEQNLNENFSENLRENLSKNTKSSVYKNSCENLGGSEQGPENLDKNSSQTAPKYKAQNFFKNALELSLQGVAGALIYAGKAGVWLSNASNCLKDEAQRAELSKINEEQAKFDGAQIISSDLVKDIVAKRLKTEAGNVEFGQIYLGKMEAFNKASREYFYEAKAKFNDFLYCFKIAAGYGEILSLKIKS
mgnify:CR=1 FL=1